MEVVPSGMFYRAGPTCRPQPQPWSDFGLDFITTYPRQNFFTLESCRMHCTVHYAFMEAPGCLLNRTSYENTCLIASSVISAAFLQVCI
jgi:hypothetical protein